MAHTVIVEIRCQPGVREQLLASLLPALEETRAFSGCRSIDAYVDCDDSEMVLLWEHWNAPEDHAAYMTWRTEEGLLDRLGPLFAGDVRVVHMQRA